MEDVVVELGNMGMRTNVKLYGMVKLFHFSLSCGKVDTMECY